MTFSLATFRAGILLLMMCWGNALLAQLPEPPRQRLPGDSADSAAPTPSAVLNFQEIQLGRSETLPLWLGDRGNLSLSAYRGMPPGFFSFSYGGLSFDHPAWGFWDEQWLPVYAGESLTRSGNRARVLTPEKIGKRTLSRIFYSEDYATNLALLDVTVRQPLGKGRFAELSGANFTAGGSVNQDLTGHQFNPYRVMVSWPLGEKWDSRFFYWQVRHRYNIPQSLTGFTADHFKTVNHRLWARLRGALSERDTLEIVPAFTDQTDKYTAISAILRENRYRYGEVHLDYFHALGQNRLGMRGDARITRQTARRAWNDKTESDGSLRLYTARNKGRISWEGEAGAYLNSSASIAPGARVLAGMSLSSATRLEFLGEHRPRAVPLLWRTVSGDSITPFTGDVWMTHRQGSVSLIQDLWGERLEMRLGAFWNRAAGYPVWQPGSRSWLRNTIENRGLQLKTRLAVSHFRLSNDFSYNADYQEAFAPEINNITEVGVRVPLFKGALFLEGLASWHYLGYYRVVAFNRFLMQYSPGLEPDRGPYYLADARVQLSVNQVIISFVFENLLSEDVEIVKGTDDTLRIFRFGVDWILFD